MCAAAAYLVLHCGHALACRLPFASRPPARDSHAARVPILAHVPEILGRLYKRKIVADANDQVCNTGMLYRHDRVPAL